MCRGAQTPHASKIDPRRFVIGNALQTPEAGNLGRAAPGRDPPGFGGGFSRGRGHFAALFSNWGFAGQKHFLLKRLCVFYYEMQGSSENHKEEKKWGLSFTFTKNKSASEQQKGLSGQQKTFLTVFWSIILNNNNNNNNRIKKALESSIVTWRSWFVACPQG